MPPKQKQVKKGPAFKNPIPSKDLVPADIKQPPRQFKSLKYPESFPQTAKNDKKSASIFEAWPADQVIKAFDFGINSQNKFQDPNHEAIKNHLKIASNWKSIHQIQKLKPPNDNLYQKENEQGKGEQNGQGQSQSGPKQPLVIETYERDETPEQTQARLKELAQQAEKAAKDKKKGKKQEVKEEGPVKVRDVKMSEIRVQSYMPEEALWIGSQLQTIKLRNIIDPFTKEAVWKKIYPQENGVPQITKSGKYWVKLYYMGQAVKIQVDDRIPTKDNYKELFATSQKRHEKWTMIITKALVKYMALGWPQEPITGSGLIIHALTGMVSQIIEVKSQSLEKMDKLLSDTHYTRKDVFMSCYTNKVAIPPSNYPKAFENKDFTLKDVAIKPSKSIQGQQNELYEKQQTVYEGQDKEPLDPQILPGYAYLLGDYFTNGDFNMAFSKERSPRQGKLRLQLNNLSKVNINNKTRDEKLEHRRKKKQIKEMLAVEEKKRLDMINQEKKQYQFIKLLNKNIKIKCQFDEKEILLAKKCRLNNLNQPPNYELPQPTVAQKQQSKSIKSFSVIKSTKQDSQVNPNIDDFSMIENVLDPLPRPQKGIWIKDIDFLNCFTKIQVIYNPTTFANKSLEKVVSAANDGGYVFDETKEILVVQRQQMGEDGIEVDYVELLFGFSYEESSTSNTQPYCILQKFDFDQFSVSSNVTKLTGKIDSTLLTLKNQNNVFKIYTMCKSNCCYWVSSNAKFKLMSISEYLEEFQGYKKKTISIEYPAIEAKTYLPIARFAIKQTSEESNSVILKINSPNPQLTKSLRYNLVKAPQQTQKFIDDQFEGVIRKSCEEKHLATDYTRLSIEPGQEYDFVLESCPFDNIPDGSCEIAALIKNESLNFDNLELVEPLRFIDKYRPNKYGLIFRERIFSNVLTKQGFLVKLVEGQEVQGGGGGGGDKKGAKKGGKQESSVEFVEKPFEKERTIIVKLVKNNQIIYQASGTNWATISNVRISNIKEKPTDEYFLQALFDLRQWPEACIQNEDTSKLCWTISVFGTDSIAVVRDIRQQEKEKQTRKSWEDSEPGRAERAKKSRRRFIIMQKKQNGQQLTQQEEQIINAPRLTKKQQQQEAQKADDKNKKGGKKDEKKGAKEVKKQEVEEKPVQIVFPKSADNCNYEIKNFIKTLENFSVKKIEKQQSQQPRIRSQEEISAIKESQKMSEENRVNKMLRNVQRRQTIKLKERDKKDQLLLHLQELNRQFKEAWSKYIVWRNEDLEKDKTKQQKERSITEILKQEKPTLSQADLDKILNEYHQIAGFNQKLYDVGIMLKKNIKILALSDKITNHVAGWQVQELKVINEQIKNDKIQGIPQNIMNDMKVMLQEVERNPGIVAEKQNQAKKAKKGGKK